MKNGAKRLDDEQSMAIAQIPYDKDVLLQRVPHTEIPHKVVNLEGGGERPHSFVEDKYAKVQFNGGCTAGQLTYLGREQAYQFGQQLREIYMKNKKIISNHFSTDEVYIRSTNIDRCISSLECVLAGLYGKENFAEDVLKIPVCMNETDGEWESLVPNTYQCAALRDFERDVPRQLMEDKELLETIQLINEKTGGSLHSPVLTDITPYRDVLVFRQTHGLPVTSWMQERKVQRIIVSGSSKLFEKTIAGLPTTRSRVLPLASGVAFNQLLENFKKAQMHNPSAKKMFLLSCHDSTLVPLLVASGCYDKRWPPYAADLRFELYEDQKGQHWVRALYCGKECKMTDCDSPVIPLTKFKEIMKPIAIDMKEMKRRCAELHEFSRTAEEMKEKFVEPV